MRPGPSLGVFVVMFALLASCRAPYKGLTPEETLVEAAKAGDYETVSSLIRQRIDVAYVQPQGNTALIEASSYGHMRIVQALLGAGAPVDQVNSAGRTALMVAAMSGRLEIVRMLIAAGADVNSEGGTYVGDLGVRFGPTTALLMSITLCQTEVIRELIRNGASVQYRGDEGRLAVDSARERDCRELIPVLEQALQHELDKERKGGRPV